MMNLKSIAFIAIFIEFISVQAQNSCNSFVSACANDTQCAPIINGILQQCYNSNGNCGPLITNGTLLNSLPSFSYFNAQACWLLCQNSTFSSVQNLNQNSSYFPLNQCMSTTFTVDSGNMTNFCQTQTRMCYRNGLCLMGLYNQSTYSCNYKDQSCLQTQFNKNSAGNNTNFNPVINSSVQYMSLGMCVSSYTSILSLNFIAVFIMLFAVIFNK